MPKISVIIPIYNAEQYLHKCVKSVLAQTLKDIEIILINDGSTDNSKQIIKQFQKEDKRIILINQKNQGVSVARNKGLEIATGEYIGFVDADDYIANDMYAKMYNIAVKDKIDIVISNFISEKDISINKLKFSTATILDNEYIQNEIIPFFIKEDGLNSACNKIYKKETTQNVIFPVGITNGEDGLFNINVFNKARKIIFIEYAGYYYRQVEGSATRNILNKDYFQIALSMYNYKYDAEILIPEKKIIKLKSIRLINTIISLSHTFLKPNKDIRFYKRYRYIKRMIENQVVQDTINKHWITLNKDKNRYFRFILKSIKIKSIFRLVLAIKYSYFRNRF